MARYIPKSKVSILETAGNEFITVSNSQGYVGPYMELSDGTFFAGNNTQNLGEQLLRLISINKSFAKSNNNSTYRKLQKPIYNELLKKINIPITKQDPLREDYERGYLTRYFCRRVNDMFSYFEINKKTYDDLNNYEDKYDWKLHVTGEIKWALLETPDKSTAMINGTNIELLLNQYPNLNTLFNNLSDYEPFHTRNLLETLYINTGYENLIYKGYLHIHPTNGYTMEGPFHSAKSHRTLLTINQVKKLKLNGTLQNRTDYTPSSPLINTPGGPVEVGKSRMSNQGGTSVSSRGGGY